MQEIVDQGIDRDQVHADFQPPRANISGTDQNARQGHGEHLVRNAVDVAQWLNQRHAHSRQGVRRGLVVDLVQTVIDPADQVALGNVANEQIQAISSVPTFEVGRTLTF